MWSILVALLLGMAVGAFFKFTDAQKEVVGKLQFYGVILLLFVMGISIGMNKDILGNISSIGVKSLSFALLTVAFSVAAVYALTSFYLKWRKN